jgi:hypothetical protein
MLVELDVSNKLCGTFTLAHVILKLVTLEMPCGTTHVNQIIHFRHAM